MLLPARISGECQGCEPAYQQGPRSGLNDAAIPVVERAIANNHRIAPAFTPIAATHQFGFAPGAYMLIAISRKSNQKFPRPGLGNCGPANISSPFFADYPRPQNLGTLCHNLDYPLIGSRPKKIGPSCQSARLSQPAHLELNIIRWYESPLHRRKPSLATIHGRV